MGLFHWHTVVGQIDSVLIDMLCNFFFSFCRSNKYLGLYHISFTIIQWNMGPILILNSRKDKYRQTEFRKQRHTIFIHFVLYFIHSQFFEHVMDNNLIIQNNFHDYVIMSQRYNVTTRNDLRIFTTCTFVT